MNKKFYWLKLKDNFFNQLEIKKLRKIAGGDTYTIIYLKLQLLSLKHEGTIYYEGIEDNIISEIALQIDEDIENVKITFMYLQTHGLIEEIENDEYLLTKMSESIGKESDSAERVRRFRSKEMVKKLQCNDEVTKGNTEIELELEKEKEKEIKKIKEIKELHLEKVLLTKEEYNKLYDKYTNETEIKQGIEILNNYLQYSGKKYKSHYHVLIGWVYDKVKEANYARYKGTSKENGTTQKHEFQFKQRNYL